MNKLIIAAVLAFFSVSTVTAQKAIDDLIDVIIKSAEKSNGKENNNEIFYEMKRDPKTKKVVYSRVILTIHDKKLGDKLEQSFNNERGNADDVKVSFDKKSYYMKLIFRKEKGYMEYTLSSEGDGPKSLMVRNRGESVFSRLNDMKFSNMEIIDKKALKEQIEKGLSGLDGLRSMTMVVDGNRVSIDRDGENIQIYDYAD